MKTKYYIITEEGEKKLVRTSSHEYHYICFGKCSKTYEGAYAEKTRIVNELKRCIAFYNEVLNNENAMRRHIKRHGIRQSEDELKAEYRRYLEADQKKLDEAMTAKVFELIAE